MALSSKVLLPDSSGVDILWNLMISHVIFLGLGSFYHCAMSGWRTGHPVEPLEPICAAMEESWPQH